MNDIMSYVRYHMEFCKSHSSTNYIFVSIVHQKFAKNLLLVCFTVPLAFGNNFIFVLYYPIICPRIMTVKEVINVIAHKDRSI